MWVSVMHPIAALILNNVLCGLINLWRLF